MFISSKDTTDLHAHALTKTQGDILAWVVDSPDGASVALTDDFAKALGAVGELGTWRITIYKNGKRLGNFPARSLHYAMQKEHKPGID